MLSSKKQKSHIYNSQKKRKRDTNNENAQHSSIQVEVPDLLETQQFSQSFMQKLLQPTEDVGCGSRNVPIDHAFSTRNTRRRQIVKSSRQSSAKKLQEEAVESEFVMRDETTLRHFKEQAVTVNNSNLNDSAVSGQHVLSPDRASRRTNSKSL